jgi:hypothetical protein
MTYTSKYVLSIVVAVGLAGLAAAQGSSALGLTSQQQAWVGVVSAILGVAASFLPRVTAAPTPERKGLD